MPILIALAAAIPTVPSAPILLPPPIVESSGRQPVTIALLDVEIRANSEVLWSGPMRVSNRTGANFSRQKSDAPAQPCTPESYYSGERSSLSVTLGMTRSGSRDDGFDIRVNWDRPASATGCDSGRNTRTVAISQSVTLEPGRETAITGDGGLSVRIRRRN